VAFRYLADPSGQGVALPGVDDLVCWYRIAPTDHQSIP